MGAQVSLCAELAPGEGGKLGVRATFWDMGSGTFFAVPPFEVESGDARAGAQKILEGFRPMWTRPARPVSAWSMYSPGIVSVP